MAEKQVLVVDNEDDQRKMMRQLLERMGYSVVVAESCEAAMDLMEKEKFPLVITDLIMPGMDGMEFCEQIKLKRAETVVYAFSGHAALYSSEKIKKSGFNAFLEKPVNVETLAREMEKAFEHIIIAEREGEH